MEHVAAAQRWTRDEAAPRGRRDLHCHDLDGEAILYDAAFNTTYRLNDTAYQIWRLCDGVRDAGEIARRMSQVYGIDEARAVQDVLSTIDEMRAQGLFQDVEGEVC